MAGIILAVNPGSSSHKYAFFEGDKEFANFYFERMPHSQFRLRYHLDGQKHEATISELEFENSLDHAVNLSQAKHIDAVGVRIVAPGTWFAEHKSIDDDYIERLKSAEEIAPLHIGSALSEIAKLKSAMPKTQLFAISDSAVHSTMPHAARTYAIKHSDTEELDIFRFGYHGVSVESVVDKLSMMAGMIHEKVIVCHLGSGASSTALLDGKSIDTTMGFSPLEGLAMATRAGSIDASAALYLAAKREMTDEQLEDYLNKQSGLLGLSTKTDDVRELIELSDEGDQLAEQALDHFAYKVKTSIGAQFAALDGLDMLVFTGTIGLRSAIMREKICTSLGSLGIFLDLEKNQNLAKEGFVNQEGTTGIAVIETNEQKQIAKVVSKQIQ